MSLEQLFERCAIVARCADDYRQSRCGRQGVASCCVPTERDAARMTRNLFDATASQRTAPETDGPLRWTKDARALMKNS